MKNILMFAVLTMLSISVMAACTNKRKDASTPFGTFYKIECWSGGKNEVTLFLGDKIIVRDSMIGYSDSHNNGSIWVFGGGGYTPDIPCAHRQYLIDLSKKPVQVLAFGVNGACSEFHWASWGKRKSVIALKRNVKFTYENGVLTAPKRSDDLFVNIEVYAGEATSINVGKIIPFVESVAVKNE